MALAAVIGSYSCYLRFAVPIIEGPPNQIKRVAVTPMPELPTEADQKSHLVPLLPVDAWELSSCKTLLTSTGTILFRDFKRLDDGSMRVAPFTLVTGIAAPQSHALAPTLNTEAEKKTPTVLRCVEGAILKFNKPISEVLAGGEAKMRSARLTGQVDIYRPPSAIGKNDAMHILTSNVKIDRQQIYTIDNVMFSFGPNQGSGRNLLINLAHENESSTPNDFSTINGIKRLELAFLDKLRIEPSRESNSMSLQRSHDAKEKTKLLSNSDSPLEIACKGPFVFDLESNTATFEDDVVALQVDAFQDSIKCEKLTLMFEEVSSDMIDKDAKSDVELKQFIAEGTPAIVMSNSRSAQISSEYLSYKVLENLIEASCSEATAQNVTLVSPDYRMVSKQLKYIVPEDGSLGPINALGAGQLLRMATPEQDEFFATWQKSLTTRNVPDRPGLQRVVIDGQAKIRLKSEKSSTDQSIQSGQNVADETRINADLLEFLVWQIPVLTRTADGKTKQSWTYHPAKLTTQGKVTIASPALEGSSQKLTATWPAPTSTRAASKSLSRFQANPRSHQVAYRGRLQLVPQNQAPQQNQFTQNGTLTQNETFTPTRLAPIGNSARRFGVTAPGEARIFGQRANQQTQQTFTSQTRQSSDQSVRLASFQEIATGTENKFAKKKRKTKIKFHGNSVDIQLKGNSSKDSQIKDLTVVGDVSITQIPLEPTASSKQPLTARPFQITGDHLRLTPQNGTENYRALVSGSVGKFAKIISNDFELAGENVNLNQIANKVWVEGAGTMKLKPSKLQESKNSRGQLGSLGQSFGEIVKKRTPDELDVEWKGGMIFDGDTIYFENGVTMSSQRVNQKGQTSKLKSESQALSVELKQPVDLTQLTGSQNIGDVEMREIIFVDRIVPSEQVFKLASQSSAATKPRPVVVETQLYDTSSKLAEQQRISVPNATFNTDTGALEATGPGSVATHQISKNSGDDPNPFARLSGRQNRPLATRQFNQGQNKPGISFIQVNFDGEMQIQSEQKKMDIRGRVRSVYSPVQNWTQTFNPDQTTRMAPGGVYLNCEHLQMAQWSPRNNTKPTTEMIATGNTRIRSDMFESSSDRVSYNQQTDTLTFDGTPRSDAKLWVKKTPNDKNPSPISAEKFTHRIAEQRTEILKISNVNYEGRINKK